MGKLAEVNDTDFRSEVLDAKGPVLVDFWAEWCGPCHRVTPEVEALALELGDALKVTKLNVDDAPETAQKYGVSSIPSLLLFVGGEEKIRVVGAKPRAAIKAEIEPFLKATNPA